MIVDLCFWEDVNYNVFVFFCSVVLDPALLGASEKRLCRVLQEDARLLPAGTEVQKGRETTSYCAQWYAKNTKF